MSEHLRQAPTLLELIEHSRDALNTCPDTDSRRTSLHLNLAILLWRLHKRVGSDDALEEMFHVARDHIALRHPGHPEPDRALCYSSLAILLTERYERSSEVALIDQAVELQHAALVLRPVGHPDRAEFCGNLAIILSTRYSQSGDVSLLDEAITMEWEVLDLSPMGHPNRVLACGNLAASLSMRYDQTGDITLLDKMIILERETLGLRPVGHPDRAMSCNNLAAFLTAYYEKTGDSALLDEVIELEREAHCFRPEGDHNRSESCGNLAVSLSARSKQTGDVALLDEAIKLHREALDLQPAGHSNRATRCSHLAGSLNRRYQQTMDVTLLEEAIVLEREALDLRPEGHPKRAISCSNLAASLSMRYAQTNNATLLDEAITLRREVCSLNPPGDLHRAMACDSLATSLITRHNQTVNIAVLDEAIELQSEALDLRLIGDPERAASCNNLAMSLSTRYKQTGDDCLLEQATNLGRTALSLRPAGHPGRSESCGNLAAFLVLRYDKTNDVALLDQAIQLEREAVGLRSAGHPNRLASCINLAVSLSRRYSLTRDVALISEAIELEEEALQNYRDRDLPDDAWRLLTVLVRLHLLPGTPHFSVQRALGYLRQAFNIPIDDLHDFIPIINDAVRSLWCFQHMWTPDITGSLLSIYTNLIDRLPMIAGFVLDAMSLLQSLKSCSQLGSDACVAAIQAGQPSKAIELLDHAHGIVWAQSLHQRDPQLKDAPPELASELEHLLRATAMPASATASEPHNSHLTPHDVRHQQNSRIRTILGEIRAMPGLERFMLGNTFEMLRKVAREHPVVVLVAAHGHVFALIMSPSSEEGPDALRLNLTQDDLQSISHSAGHVHLRQHARAEEVGRDASTREHFFLEDWDDSDRVMRPGHRGSRQGLLATLWSTVVKPVLTHLGIEKVEDANHRPRLHWCTAGDFASLPIHAAGIYTGHSQECCSDCVVSSYTPTLSSLLRARQNLQPVTTAEANLLLVAAEHMANTSLSALPSVQEEMRVIGASADKAGVPYAAPSRIVFTAEQAAAALPSATLVHIACHGLQDTEQPLESAFYLSDSGVLSVSDIMELNLESAYLAFLSACETAKGDRKQPGQAIHLAATMLFVGFKSIVATMWAMRDDDGPLIAKAFYEKLFDGKTITADTIPQALDHAVRKLRESGAPVERWATFIHVGA